MTLDQRRSLASARSNHHDRRAAGAGIKVGELIRAWRTLERKQMKDAAMEIGIPLSTLWRLEHGKAVDQATVIKLMNWLFA